MGKTKHISYTLEIIDSTRFMASLLSNLVNNFSSHDKNSFFYCC